MRIVKLNDHQYAQARVILHDDGTITLRSYKTDVVQAIPYGKNLMSYELHCTGTYSRTTIRHIGWFMREYFNLSNYYDIKKIAGTGDSHITRLTKY